MSLLGLGAYATSSDSEEEEEVQKAAAPAIEEAPLVDTVSAPATAPARADKRKADTFAAFGKKARRNLASTNRLPLFSKPAAIGSDSDDEDGETRKRLTGRTKAKGPGILGFLPKPVNALPDRKAAAALDDVFSRPRPAPTAAPGPAQPGPAVPDIASEADMYRVDDSGSYVNAGLAQAAADEGPSAGQSQPFDVGAEDLLTAAMEAEQEKARRRGQHVAAADFKFTEVKAATLTAMTPDEQAEADAIRLALSTGYARQLQEETAGKNEPTKLSKRKHQISSLYHQARMHELQDMEKKTAGVQSKAETAAKYGW